MKDIEKTNIEKYIEENGSFIATPVGTSMWPMLRNRRDCVYLEKYEGNLKKYDIPIYKRSDGSQVMHRCLEVCPDGTYAMCGDHQCQKEYGIRPDQIFAVARGFYHDNKYISCDNKLYKFYCRVWCLNLRLRGYMIHFLHIFYSPEKAYFGYKTMKNKK